jgi:hypothetical protein
MERRRDRRVVAGVVLVGVGAVLLVLQFVGELGAAVPVLALGAIFLVGYFTQRRYGLLVAGGVIVGVGLGQIGELILDDGGGIQAAGLGVGFLTIYVIDRSTRESARWWPLIPGLILVAAGLSSVGGPYSDVIQYTWPLFLVAAGVILIVRGPQRRPRP